MNPCAVCSQPVPIPKRGQSRKTCSNPCRQKLYRRAEGVTPLPTPLGRCNTPPVRAYTAANIVIMGASDRMSNPMFDWELAEDLAHEIIRPVEWIKRGIWACREAGVSPQYFIDRYLYRKDIPMNKHVDVCFRKILDEAQS